MRRGPLLLALLAWLLPAANATAHGFEEVRPVTAHIVDWSTLQDARAGALVDSAALFALKDMGDRHGGIAVSPDGARVALMVRSTDLAADSYRYELVVVTLGEPARAQVLAEAGGFIYDTRAGRRSGGSIDRAPAWSADGRSLAYIAEVDGRAELWRIDFPQGRPRQAAALEGDARRFAWVGDTLVVESLRARGEIARETDATRRYGFLAGETYEPGYAQDAMIDDSGGPVLAITATETRPATAREIAALEGIAEPARIVPRDPAADVAMPDLAVQVERAGGRMLTCASPLCAGALEDAWASADGAQVYFRRLEDAGATNAIYRWDLNSGAVTLMRHADERLEGCALRGADLICLRDTPSQPRQLVLIDLIEDANRTRVLFEPNPGWRQQALPRIDRLSVRDSDGDASFAHLVYPVGWRPGRRYGLVIVQYRSRGFLFGGTGRDAPIFPLSARGYFVLSVDRPEAETLNRTEPLAEVQRRTEFDGAENAIKVAAIEALIAACVERGLVDRGRVALTGMSDGAETVYAMLDRGIEIRAAVVSTPPLDPFAWALMSGTFRSSQINRFGMQSPWETNANGWEPHWRRESSFYHAAHYRTPLMLNLAESEVLFAMPLVTRLRELGAPVELYVYPGAYHNKVQPLQLLSDQQRSMDWIDYWLSGRERTPPDDPGRVERWRALRSALTQAH